MVFLFNVGGYYIVFWGIQHQAKRNLLQRLDANDYSDDEVTVLSIPVALPYPIHQGDYERVDGEFEYLGDHYKLVKQKLENDTLFLVCIKDVVSKKISDAMVDYSGLANSLPVGSKQAHTFLDKLSKDFNTSEFVQWYRTRQLFEKVFYAEQAFPLLEQPRGIDSPPPEMLF